MKVFCLCLAVLGWTTITALDVSVAGEGSSVADVSSLSTDEVVKLLQSWGLDKAFSMTFKENEVSGSLLATYFKRGRVDELKFAPESQPYQWDALWDHLEELTGDDDKQVELRQQPKPKRMLDQRRRLEGSTAALNIMRDNGWIKFGADLDTGIGRIDEGALAVQGTLSRIDPDTDKTYLIVDEQMLSEAIDSAVANRKCQAGFTGKWCNETCTDISYFATASCYYHHTPSTTDLQIQEAAAYINFYKPDMAAATVQCCDDDSCSRQNSAGSCWVGSYDTSDPFKIFVTFEEAKATCEDEGMRLCTLAEMEQEGHDCCGAGCGYDYTVVWTTDVRYDCDTEYAAP